VLRNVGAFSAAENGAARPPVNTKLDSEPGLWVRGEGPARDRAHPAHVLVCGWAVEPGHNVRISGLREQEPKKDEKTTEMKKTTHNEINHAVSSVP